MAAMVGAVHGGQRSIGHHIGVESTGARSGQVRIPVSMVAMRPVSAWLAALLLAVALGACGDDDDAGEPAQEPVATTETTADTGPSPLERDPCALLDGARIRALFGERVRGRAEEGDDANVCGYRSRADADPDANPPVPSGVDVFLGVPYFVEIARITAQQGGVEALTPLPGIGDSAYVIRNRASAVVGDAGIMVVILGLDPSAPAVQELLTGLLEDAVAAY